MLPLKAWGEGPPAPSCRQSGLPGLEAAAPGRLSLESRRLLPRGLCPRFPLKRTPASWMEAHPKDLLVT